MVLLSDLKKGKRGAIAKAITIIENDKPGAKKILKKIFRETGTSIVIGITGPAGGGKSSLINKTVIALRKLHTKPAVLAVDPTSHITGGAILGDRVRMSESTDFGIYIRSIASRGATGAVSRSLRNSVRILEYAGFNPIIIESVGAGQTEVEISKIADITVVVFNPNTGDSIQTIKAGLTEIGDIYLVNKSDLDGTNQLFDAVRDFIGSSERNPIVLKTSVKRNSGIIQFAKILKEMMASKKKSKKERDKERLETELKEIVLNNFKEKMDEMLDSDKTFSKYLKKLLAKDIDPYAAADKISKSLIK
ncbi:MAG: methylmalonyl Co-A mutase-associated GTPase MeaB [Thaumarchaeota archaeon]|nr:methylmalonyl Co-A mutase-associated GTPase MeaB [Nitrososphaerota archaeon]